MSKVEQSGSGALALQQPGPGAGSAAAAAAAANGNGGSHSSSKREKTPGSGMSPCAACKLLRRRCAKECVFAPYFPPDEPQKFANVHKVFGASNVNKMLQDLPLHQRSDAVGSMVYEADSRVRDPVYGCVGLISALQQQVASLQQQVASAQAEIVCLRMQAAVASNVVSMKAGMGMGVLGLQGSSGGSSSMGASHSSITSHSSMGTSHPSHHSPHHSHSHSHSHPSPHHSHHSPHQSSHQSHTPHHSPPLQPESPELHHQYKPAGMLMGIDTLDIGQAMWA